MKITQVLNNNVVSVTDNQGQELILTGCGLGFHSRTGQDVEMPRVEKIFRLQDNVISARFKDLAQEVPLEILQLTSDIVETVKKQLQQKLSEGIYVTLADHLAFALQCQRNGTLIQNPLHWEVRHFYKQEYAVAEQALALIRETLGVTLPEDEACSIALHIVNAELGDNIGNMKQITQLIYQVQNIVKYYFQVPLDENNGNYYRFITHLKFFSQRVVEGASLDNDDGDLFTMVQQRYQKTLGCVEAINTFIKKNYQHTMTNSEKLYLTIHIDNMIHYLTQNNSSCRTKRSAF
ncbi:MULTISPECIES: BglG family transcription antiterminator LicT [Dickeya]|uniref:Transcription antiterminator LicT n=1 Tax=Dickeya fangzhongdai TaxID=1778540 RepID=A0A2K8QRL1_9GAMM|nr:MULTISPECIES: PRD domain-containing protein [Dickeya]ATZ95715.1 transcription antiterminator LicT [Dickeya fangzhongdai]QOH49160.1 PRD domain-containing protein [Dickeya fangzhongdai]QOH53463.1 PRD domain-containing protein [Dickeya fangzhongdai]WOX99334.1 PRD domain-containing protein [Dickeya fangzhongdai]WOY05514.1 PRD domain-containing protein [Dickeya fangzhongdai]